MLKSVKSGAVVTSEYNDPTDALKHLIDSHLADAVNTALECVIVSYSAGRVTVKPIGTKNFTDGDSNAFPQLYDLPLHWPQGDGGNCGVKIPVKAGDKCLAVFSQQPQDEGDTEQVRRFSMADGYVIPGVGYSDAKPGNDNLMLYYGDAYIEITPDGKINFNAPGGMNFKTPLATFSEKVTVTGLFAFNGGATGQGGSGTTITIKGRIVTDQATINGKDFMGHYHINSGGSGNGGAVG